MTDYERPNMALPITTGCCFLIVGTRVPMIIAHVTCLENKHTTSKQAVQTARIFQRQFSPKKPKLQANSNFLREWTSAITSPSVYSWLGNSRPKWSWVEFPAIFPESQ
jgi:hypothetical protein